MRVLFIFTVLIFNLFSNSIDDKIKELKKAPKEQKYRIMNQIKMELIKLNQSQREYFIQKLMKSREIRDNNIKNTTNYNKNSYHQNIKKLDCNNDIKYQDHSHYKNGFKNKKNNNKNGNKSGHRHK